MGMYDTLIIDCPDCFEEIEVQSKSGRCCMDRYNLHNVPLEIVLSLRDKKIVCKKCGKMITISSNYIVDFLG